MLQSLMILFDCLSVYSAVKKKKKLHVRGKDGQFPKASQNEAKKKKNLSVREIHFVFCKTFYVLHNTIYVNFN